MIYFDHNSTTSLRSDVADKMREISLLPYNASAVHHLGRRAKLDLEQARREILSSLGVSKFQQYQVIFTASASEANNLMVHSFADYTIINSSIEHTSVLLPAKEAKQNMVIGVTHDGLLDMCALEKALAKDASKKIVSVIYANNETGVIQDLSQIIHLAHQYQALVHTDAVQAYGKIKIDLLALGVDLITISAHKICGPLGVGALIAKENLSLCAQIKGGGQEKNLRAGTHNLPAIVGFGMIAGDLGGHIEKISKIETLRNYIETSLAQEAVVFSKKAPRLPNTSCIAMPGVENEMQVMHFDLQQIFLSAGSACSSGKIKFSHVLKAYGYAQELIQCAIRISLGLDNTKDDADIFIKNWFNIYEKLGVKKQYA